MKSYHTAEQASQYTVLTIRINEMRTPIALSLALLILLAGCQRSPEPPVFSPRFVAVPAQGESTSPRLNAGPGGELILSWMESSDAGTALRFASFEDAAWGSPGRVVSGAEMFVNWADLPSVVPMGGDRLAAHWLQQSGDHSHAYDIAFSESLDDGATWSDALRPHRDGTATQHGFVSLFGANEATGLLWLDGRNTVNDVTDDPVASGMTLRAAMVRNGEALDNEQMVDELVCDCCQTDIAVTGHGAVAVYRDRSVDEIRDIAITRHLDGKWQPGRRVAEDNWEMAGCPINGPAIGADDSRVAVAWFTAAEKPTVRLSVSNDSGETFGPPITIAQQDSIRRVDLVLLEDGDVAVSWLRSVAAGATIRVRRVSATGKLGQAHTVSDAPSQLSVPQMGLSGGYLVFAWAETGAAADRVVSARVEVASL